MNPKQKARLVFWAGTAGFCLVCLAIATARCVAAELPRALFAFPFALYVAFVGYVSGMDIGARRSPLTRLAIVLLSAMAAAAVIWLCQTVLKPAEAVGVPGNPVPDTTSEPAVPAA